MFRAITPISVAVAVAIASVTEADTVRITMSGSVSYANSTTPQFAGVDAGAAAQFSFELDSNDFIDDAGGAARGYAIDVTSFVMALDEVEVGLGGPFPPGFGPYFQMFLNASAHAVRLSTHPELFNPVALDAVGPNGHNMLELWYSFWPDNLPSLDVLDATGTYQADELIGAWTIRHGWALEIGVEFSEFTIEIIASTCPADLDANGTVNVDDLLAVLAAWGTPEADLDSNGVTDVQDLLALLSAWGSCNSSS